MHVSRSLSSALSPEAIAWLKTALYTAIALVAFAANSIICRLALGTAAIDPSSYTVIRLMSGAVVLAIIAGLGRGEGTFATHPGQWLSALMLFIYATTFSLAYVSLSAGTGALILFGSVQATMFSWGILKGERPCLLQYGGMVTATAGFVFLMLPGLQAPSLLGACLMAAAGISWGVYSVRGQGAGNSVAVTADNFLRTLPFSLPMAFVLCKWTTLSMTGVILAVVSGALTSGLGYVIWYTALKGLSTTRAAVVQLLVPVIAAVGGIVFLHEEVSLHLIVAAVLIMSGAGTYILYRRT